MNTVPSKRPADGELSTPAARRRAWWHFQFVDHAVIRHWWWNLHEIAPGVWRSNHPSPARLRRYKEMGIKSVISLRGNLRKSPMLFEEEACATYGLNLIYAPGFGSRIAPRKDAFASLRQAFQTAQKPFVVHCKSGADRTGMAAALYLIMIEGRPAEEAMQQLHWRYVHFKRAKAGVLDHVFRVYVAARDATGISFEDWVETAYDRDEITASFAMWRKGGDWQSVIKEASI
ncbi:tyrosine-protein phosphatase [Octadecabacter sp. R77987]|uniref:tyrosine-protein phosphatase n=1 Tax=Octadecabacter sp. R77987 TaxID=3093874 RepID=UPI00366ABA94